MSEPLNGKIEQNLAHDTFNVRGVPRRALSSMACPGEQFSEHVHLLVINMRQSIISTTEPEQDSEEQPSRKALAFVCSGFVYVYSLFDLPTASTHDPHVAILVKVKTSVLFIASSRSDVHAEIGPITTRKTLPSFLKRSHRSRFSIEV